MSEVDRVRRAASTMRLWAQRADTGEQWEATKHYDDMYCVDFKPSVPDPPGEGSPRNLPEDPEDPGVPRPADIYVHHFQAQHIALWHPGLAPLVAAFLEAEADHHADDPSFERDTDPLCDAWPHVMAISRALEEVLRRSGPYGLNTG